VQVTRLIIGGRDAVDKALEKASDILLSLMGIGAAKSILESANGNEPQNVLTQYVSESLVVRVALPPHFTDFFRLIIHRCQPQSDAVTYLSYPTVMLLEVLSE
jgi:hypothetical protein